MCRCSMHESPLIAAAANGQPDLVRYLLDARARANLAVRRQTSARKPSFILGGGGEIRIVFKNEGIGRCPPRGQEENAINRRELTAVR